MSAIAESLFNKSDEPAEGVRRSRRTRTPSLRFKEAFATDFDSDVDSDCSETWCE